MWTCVEDPRFKGHLRGRLRHMVTFFALVDLAAILPAYLVRYTTLDLRFVRAVRLMRLFRVAKLGRYSESLHTLKKVVKNAREEMIITVCLLFVILMITSGLMYYAENKMQPEAFSSIPAAMWWAAAALTTVGYGDIYPVTAAGKVLGALVAVLGVGLFGLPAGILAAGFIEEIRLKRVRRQVCPHCGKVISEPPVSADFSSRS